MKKRLVFIITLSMSTLLMACQQKEVETVVFSEEDLSIGVNNTEERSGTTAPELPKEEAINEESSIVADYSICTDKSAQEVENFAKLVTEYYANEDWNSLAQVIYYPIVINDKYYADVDKFLAEDWSILFSESYKKIITEAQTSNLFCNWQGIALADGEIWINEIDVIYPKKLTTYKYSASIGHRF